MISWWWLIPVGFVSFWAGFLLAALLDVARTSDDLDEEIRRELGI